MLFPIAVERLSSTLTMHLRGARQTTMCERCQCGSLQTSGQEPGTDPDSPCHLDSGLSSAKVHLRNNLKENSFRLSEYSDMRAERQRAVMKPLMEFALLAWLNAQNDCINLSGDLFREHAERIIKGLH